MKPFQLTRRKFFFLSALGLGGGAYWFARRPVRVGLIGAGTQGASLAKQAVRTYWLGGPWCAVKVVCDVDQERAEGTRREFCPDASVTGDYNQILERPDVEAVLIATPDHWHARIAHDALKAGKAVYCEKPIGLTVSEGQLLVRTVQETGKIFQGGTQQRSSARFHLARDLVRGGKLGAIHTASINLPQRWQGEAQGPFQAQPVPTGLDWERWLGQSPLVDYCPQRCHGFFRRWYEYSGGQMTDWGAHHLDSLQWILDVGEAGPETIEGHAALPSIPNGFNTPIEFQVHMKYPGGVDVTVKSHPDYDQNGIRLEGDLGWLFVNRERIEGSDVVTRALEFFPQAVRTVQPGTGWKSNILLHHLRQFCTAIRWGEAPVADVVSMHRSATVCHLANISLRLGRKLTWDSTQEVFVGDAEANAMLRRDQRAPYQFPG